MDDVRVGSLMNRSVVTTGTETPLPELVHLIRDNNIPCVVVVEGNRPVGVVTERDLVKALGEVLEERSSKWIHAAEVMTTPPVVVEQGKPLFEALVLAQSYNTMTLIVADQNEMLCGVLAHADMARAYKQIIEQQRQIIERETRFETRQLHEVNDQLKSLSTEDALLGIGNRRSMEVDLSYTHHWARRYERRYAVVVYDLDCLNHYNRHYGRPAGDDALKLVVEHLRCTVRKGDRLYRFGGEELLVLLPETGYEGASIMAGRIAHELAERNIPHAGNAPGVLTISGGVAAFEPGDNDDTDWRVLVDQAFACLQEAKSGGRNRIGGGSGPVNASDDRAHGPAEPVRRDAPTAPTEVLRRSAQ